MSFCLGGKKVGNFKKSLSVFLCLLLSFLSIYLATGPNLRAGVCEDARGACFVDAIIIALLSGIAQGLIYADLCLIGYRWCKKYYRD
jgi:hypothetical protein